MARADVPFKKFEYPREIAALLVTPGSESDTLFGAGDISCRFLTQETPGTCQPPPEPPRHPHLRTFDEQNRLRQRKSENLLRSSVFSKGGFLICSMRYHPLVQCKNSGTRKPLFELYVSQASKAQHSIAGFELL